MHHLTLPSRLALFIFLTFLWSGTALGCDVREARSVIDALLNWELDLADSRVADWRKADPDNPSLELYDVIVQVARIDYSPSRDPKRFDSAIKQLNRVIKLNEQRAQELPGESIYRYNLATAKAIAGRLLLEKKRWLKAFFHGRDSRRMMRALVVDDPEFTDAYLVLGMFDYFTSSFPSIMQWISTLVGFEPDRDNGLVKLERAIRSAQVAGPYAADSLLLEVSHDQSSACRYKELASMMKQSYPRNPRYRRIGRKLEALCSQLPPDERPMTVQFRLVSAECAV